MEKDKPESENKENEENNSSLTNNSSVVSETNNKKSETAKTIQDYLFKSFYNRKNDLVKQKYEFWDTQPVPKITTKEITSIGPMETNNDVKNEKQIPYKLPTGFSWHDIDINNSSDVDRLYEFLRDNYVEDEDHTFRFDYSRDFLRWHLTAPGSLKNWQCAVVKDSDKSLIGFISAIPVHISIFGKEVAKVEINFLCVHAKFRSYRIAPVLIKEITRRVHLQDIWQAVYTAGILLPKPIAKCKYYHRNLNFKKLLDVKFTYMNPKLNLARSKKIYKLPTETNIPGLRKMEAKDCEQVYKILTNYVKKFDIHPVFTIDEVKHWFVPREGVVFSYVVEDLDKKEITDFISFYSLPSSVLNHEKHKTLNAAYSFFNVPCKLTLKNLMKNALILANSKGFDVYNALNIMENDSVFAELLFGSGDGSLKYYFYNYQCPEINPNNLALVLM